MNQSGEYSRGGSRLLRHAAAEQGAPDFAVADAAQAAAVQAHFDRWVGPVQLTYHEIVSDLVHVDVQLVAPTPARDCWTLYTTGMSDRPMHVPPQMPIARAELMLALPPHWPLTHDALQDERWYWPIRLLKTLARFPHQYGTWLGPDHTIPNGTPPALLLEGLPFCAAYLFPPLSLPAEGAIFDTPNGRTMALAVYPITREELELKLDRGAEALTERFGSAGVTDVLDPERRSVARRRMFGVF